MTIPDAAAKTSTEQVLAEVGEMIGQILNAYGMDELEVEMQTLFHEDLEMESIDLVTLAAQLADKYGPEVNLAEFLADKDLEDVIGLTIGDVVNYVVSRINQD